MSPISGQAVGLILDFWCGLPVLIVAIVVNIGMALINRSGLRHDWGRTKAIPLAILGLGGAVATLFLLAIWMVPVLLSFWEYSGNHSGDAVWDLILVITEVVAVVVSGVSLVASLRVLKAARRKEPPGDDLPID
jgi:hypothetical protein